jgi:hypothetical protein
MAFATQRLPKLHVTSDVSVATERLRIPSQRTGEKLPYDKVSSIRGANTLFQGGKEDNLANRAKTRVEAWSNTSTVTLRVVGYDENGSLKCEGVK